MSSEPAMRAPGLLRVAGVALLCTWLSLAPSARAEQAAAEPDERAYRALVDQALTEFKLRNWPEARVLFRRAHELSPSARTLRGLGVVSYEMRDYVTAIVALEDALADPRQPLTPAQRRQSEELLARARTFVGAYELSLEPQEATLRLDGQPVVRDRRGRLLVPFGDHTLQAAAEGYQESTSELSVQGGERGSLRVVLYRPPTAAQPATPVANVEKVVEQRPSEEPLRAAAPEPDGRARRGRRGLVGGGPRYGWVALGATVALGGSWAAVWFSGERRAEDVRERCAREPCRPGGVDLDDVRRFERASNALLGLTTGALVASAVLFALEWPRERRIAVAPLGPGLSLRGSF